MIVKGRFSGEDCVYQLLLEMLQIQVRYKEMLENGVSMPPSERRKGEKRKKTAIYCHICEGPLLNDRVLDHDHVSGRFLGIAHEQCNLERKEPQKIVVMSHNFTGYDSHYIVREFGKEDIKKHTENLRAIPVNTQKFKTITWNCFQMIDSAAFLPDSLEKLVGILVESNHDFPLLKQR